MNALSKKIKEAAQAKGLTTIPQIVNLFNSSDTKGQGFLSVKDELPEVMKEMGLILKKLELTSLKKIFDPENTGNCTLSQFVAFFAPDIPENRQKAVDRAFKILDSDNDKEFTYDQIRERLGNQEFAILGGRKIRVDDFIKELDSTFHGSNGKVAYSDFSLFYKELSADINDDSYWDEILAASWDCFKK